MPIKNIAFYKFTDLTDLPNLRTAMRTECRRLGLKGSILLSPEGINGFLAGSPAQVDAFTRWVADAAPGLAGLTYKESFSETVPFGKMLVKLKKEIIPLGMPEIRPTELTGKRLSPRELCEWLDQGRDLLIVDTRNGYEIQHGSFENAVDLGLSHFRDFPQALDRISPSEREKPVVMFCTGGIRCEKATAVAMKMGFKDVYQLEGGILNYFEDCGGKHYRGNCFVFDERVALDPSLKARA